MGKTDHEYTDNIVCPYCGAIDEDSWEYEDDSGEMECGDCGKEFFWSRTIVNVQYSTKKTK